MTAAGFLAAVAPCGIAGKMTVQMLAAGFELFTGQTYSYEVYPHGEFLVVCDNRIGSCAGLRQSLMVDG